VLEAKSRPGPRGRPVRVRQGHPRHAGLRTGSSRSPARLPRGAPAPGAGTRHVRPVRGREPRSMGTPPHAAAPRARSAGRACRTRPASLRIGLLARRPWRAYRGAGATNCASSCAGVRRRPSTHAATHADRIGMPRDSIRGTGRPSTW